MASFLLSTPPLLALFLFIHQGSLCNNVFLQKGFPRCLMLHLSKFHGSLFSCIRAPSTYYFNQAVKHSAPWRQWWRLLCLMLSILCVEWVNYAQFSIYFQTEHCCVQGIVLYNTKMTKTHSFFSYSFPFSMYRNWEMSWHKSYYKATLRGPKRVVWRNGYEDAVSDIRDWNSLWNIWINVLKGRPFLIARFN